MLLNIFIRQPWMFRFLQGLYRVLNILLIFMAVVEY